MWKQIQQHPIRLFALICVAASSIFLVHVTNQLMTVLSSAEWCAKALQAERITPGTTFVGLVACVDLLKLQVSALALALHIVLGGFVSSLVVLVIIVIAGAKGSVALPGGINANVSPAADAADDVADAAVSKAADIKDALKT